MVARRIRIAHSLKTLGSFLILLVLFASGAEATLLNSPTLCEAISGSTQEIRLCLPNDAQTFPDPEEFVVSDDQDPLFVIGGDPTAIILTMNSGVTGSDLDITGFRLIGLESDPPIIAPIELGDIEYLGNWNSEATSLPFVTNSDQGATIEWTTLAGANPISEAAIRINLNFVPEPGTGLLMGLGLAALSVGRRSGRQEGSS